MAASASANLLLVPRERDLGRARTPQPARRDIVREQEAGQVVDKLRPEGRAGGRGAAARSGAARASSGRPPHERVDLWDGLCRRSRREGRPGRQPSGGERTDRRRPKHVSPPPIAASVGAQQRRCRSPAARCTRRPRLRLPKAQRRDGDRHAQMHRLSSAVHPFVCAVRPGVSYASNLELAQIAGMIEKDS